MSIRNFKSIREITFSNIRNLNILVGRNSSGKSNMFEVLLLLQHAVSGSEIRNLYESRNGFENISFGRNPNNKVIIEIQTILDGEERKRILDNLFKPNTSIEIDKVPETRFLRTLLYELQLGKEEWSEKLLTDDQYNGQLSLVKRSGNLNNHKTEFLVGKNLTRPYPSSENFAERANYKKDSGSYTRIVLGHVGSDDFVSEVAGLFRKFLEQIRWMSPHRAGPIEREISGDDQIDPEGTRCASVVHTLLTRDTPEYHEILSEMGEMIPDVERVLTPTSGTQIDLRIREKRFPSDILFSWDNLSSGIRNLLNLLCLVAKSPSGSILFIEEPEIHLHPGNQRRIFDYLKEKS